MSVLLLPCLAACGHVSAHRATAGATNDPGIYFALPQTIVVVKGSVKTITKKASTCPKSYADDLGLTQLTAGSTTTYSDLAIDTRSEADPGQLYRLEAKAGVATSLGLSVELNDRQSLTSGKTDAKGEGFELTAKVLNIGGTVVGSILKAMYGAGAPLAAKKVCAPGAVGCVELCAAAMADLGELRENRRKLLGNAYNVTPASKEVLDAQLAELASLEVNLTAVLVGEREIESRPFECSFAPQPKVAAVTVFPAPAAGVTCHGATGTTALSVHLTSTAPFGTNIGATAEPLPGLPYRIPAFASLVLMNGTSTAAAVRKPVAQLGAIAYLPTEQLAASAEFKLDPDTGALVAFSGKQQSAAVSSATAAGEAASSMSGAVGELIKGRANASAAADKAELEALERKQKKLEAEKKIRELEQVKAATE